jgi:hypothetical protein
MPMNDWQVGTLYDKKFNGIHWSQPGGPFTKVLPVTQVQANSNLLTTEPFTELTGTWMLGCGHSLDNLMLQLDYDHINRIQVMLVLCPTCSYVTRIFSPATDAYNPLTAAIITP